MRAPVRIGIELVSAVLGLGLLVVVVLTLTGSMAWVVTTGVSMEPEFSDGDVAVVRPADSYEVGDVIAYRNQDLGRIVLHRIIDRVDGRLVTRGDNNDWVDSYRPTTQDVLGSLRLHLPLLGRLLELLFRPAVAAGVVFLGTVLVLGTGARQRLPAQVT